MYTVKEVAKCLNLTEHTIRYYTDKGLVPSIKRDKNNTRIFNGYLVQKKANDLVCLLMILKNTLIFVWRNRLLLNNFMTLLLNKKN